MIWNTPYILLLSISSLISIGLIIYALRHRNANGGLAFAWLMAFALIWSVGYTLEIVSSNFNTKVFWLNVQQIGIFGSPIAWLVLALQYCGKDKWLHKKYMIPLSLMPILAILLIWTNDIHFAMRLDVFLESSGQLSVVKTVRSPLALFFIVYSYLLLIISLFLFIASFKRAVLPYSGQLFILIISLLLPVVTMLMDLLKLNPFAPFGPTSSVFIISGLLVAWSLFRYQLFSIWPIARDKVIDEMQDGIIVTDPFGKIVDKNTAAWNILEQNLDNFTHTRLNIGQSLDLLLKLWPEWRKCYKDLKEHQIEVSLDSKIYYEIKISLIKTRKGKFIGHLTVLNDITNRKRIERDLFKQATTDYLTGIFNRRHFIDLSKQEYLIASRYHKPLSLIILDIDHFKRVNDTYGHMAGDKVLKQFTSICKNLLREADIFGRIGGEEFAVTLPDTAIDGGFMVGEKIRSTLEQVKIQIDDVQFITITVSVGVSSKLEHDISFESLLHRADDLLYKAKENRNCVRVH